MPQYKGSCHCGAIKFEFSAPTIESGLRCNCSICQRKGAIMSAFTLAPSDLLITATPDSLSTYEFGSHIAKHHFCSKCGIYPFHQTMRKPGRYRINLGCIEGMDSSSLPFQVYDGASI
ncbi:GFA family protein [Pseudomonas sp.]|uniref:GFA family protein n=1 Tax=Pseudomonas sp. TaxID=306 RepID=UPI0039C9A0B3